MTNTTPALIGAISDALGTVITWVGTVITQITSSTGALYPLLPVFAVGIAVSVVLLGIKIIRGFTWGA